MTTTVEAAAREATTGARQRSREAARLYTDLMAIEPDVRRQFIRGLSERELVEVFTASQREGGTPYAIYRDDALGFVEDVLGEATWSVSRKILRSLTTHNLVAIPSCFSSSKSWTLARSTLWFSSVHPVGTARVVTLAPQWRQVSGIMWGAEIRGAHARAGLPGEVGDITYKIKDASGVWQRVAEGIVGNPRNEASTQGIHCFDDQTELLTDQGWKPFPEVTGDERVLTLNGDVAEWGPITKVWRHPFDGYLNLHDGDRVNFCITDNHRLLTRPMHQAKTAQVACRYCDSAVGSKGLTLHERAHERRGEPRLRDEVLRVGDAPGGWRLREYADLPDAFYIRRTNTWAGSNPETVTFERPTVEAVLCAGCGGQLPTPGRTTRERALAGLPVYHRACLTAASRASVTCSRCGTPFTVPRSQARRAKRLYCPGGTCRTGSRPAVEPESTVVLAYAGPSRGAVANNRHRHFEFDFLDWAAFLGWYVSEGSASPHGGTWIINIAQEPGAKYDEIARLLDRMGIVATRAKHGLKFASTAIGAWLREHCGVGSENKRIPVSIKEASTEAINTFLVAYGKGDGARHTHENSRRYVTSSPLLVNDLHEVLCKIGRGRKVAEVAPEGSWSVNQHGRRFQRRRAVYTVMDPGAPVDSNVSKQDVVKHRYTGTVYCISTPHQTMMVRRKGCAMWSGNSPNVLVLVDEAGGIPWGVGRNLRALLTAEGTQMVAIGNPPSDDEGTWFEDLCSRDDVLTIPIPAFSTPNFTGEKVARCRSCPPGAPNHTIAKHLVRRSFVDEIAAEFGEESPYYQAKVMARFPKGGSLRIMPSQWVSDCVEVDEPDGQQWVALDELGLQDERVGWKVKRGAWVRLGVDIASDGGDEFVIARSVGDLGTIEHKSSGSSNSDPVTVAGVILEQIKRAQRLRHALGTKPRVRVKIDVIGLGWGPVGILKAWGSEGLHDAEIVGVNVAEATGRDDIAESAMRPALKRDEMWIAMRHLVQPQQDGSPGIVRLRIDRRTMAQLTTPSYGTNTQGKIKVESKGSVKKRIPQSPDRAEALLLAFYEPLVDDDGAHAPRLLV